jgi:hypothetical protein
LSKFALVRIRDAGALKLSGEARRMKILLVTVGLVVLEARNLAPNRPGQAAATAIKADELGIKVEIPREIRDAKNGDEGYVCFLAEIAGRLYVLKNTDLTPTPDTSCRLHIRRVPAGVLVERNSHTIAVHRQVDASNMDWYFPVVGILKSK